MEEEIGDGMEGAIAVSPPPRLLARLLHSVRLYLYKLRKRKQRRRRKRYCMPAQLERKEGRYIDK